MYHFHQQKNFTIYCNNMYFIFHFVFAFLFSFSRSFTIKMSSIDLDDDLIFFNLGKSFFSLDVYSLTTEFFELDSLIEEEYCSCVTSDLVMNDYPSVDQFKTTLRTKLNDKKMSDITDLLDSIEFNDKQENLELISTNVLNYLCTHNLQNTLANYEKYRWETEENYLKHGELKSKNVAFSL